MKRRFLLAALTSLLSANATVPAGETDRTTTEQHLAPTVAAPISYAIAVEWTSSTHTFVTREGYTVHLDTALVGAATAELVPCPEARAATWWPVTLGPRPAFANHSVTHDGSLVSAPKALSLFSDGATELGVGHASGRAYCAVFVRFEPLAGQTFDGVRMSSASILLAGRITRGSFSRTFDLAGVVPSGVRAELPILPSAASRAGARIVVTLHPESALDGARELEPAQQSSRAMSDVDLAYAFLRGLGRGAVARIEPFAESP